MHAMTDIVLPVGTCEPGKESLNFHHILHGRFRGVVVGPHGSLKGGITKRCKDVVEAPEYVLRELVPVTGLVGGRIQDIAIVLTPKRPECVLEGILVRIVVEGL